MKYCFILLVMLICSAGAHAQATDTAATVPTHALAFDPARDAAADIRTATIEAARSGKRILLDVGGNWCKWCKRLDTLFLTHAEAARCLDENFVVVKVNFSKENDNKALLSAYPKIPGYPHFFILESDGTFLHSQDTGVLEKDHGYDAEKIIAFLQKWAKQRAQ
jgi:thiol:disulfide interchange protein